LVFTGCFARKSAYIAAFRQFKKLQSSCFLPSV
jgi:hypothetical protein